MSSLSAAESTGAPRFAGTAWQLWLSTAVRVVLGTIMVTAGALKAMDPAQAVRAVQAYELVPASIDDVVGYGLPLLELALGLLLLLGLGVRLAAVLTGVFMLVFIVGVASAWARGLSIDCGCFGGGGAVNPAGRDWRYLAEILRDLLFLGMASWLAVFPASRFSLDRVALAGSRDLGLTDEEDDLDEDDPDEDGLQRAEHAADTPPEAGTASTRPLDHDDDSKEPTR